MNKVILIGNLTRDPELRYTPAGIAVVTLGLATNRRWKTQDGSLKDEAQFHRIVAWKQLAEVCAQLLKKGRRIYVEGRIQYREYVPQDSQERRKVTEIVMEDMILLDGPRQIASEPVSDQAAEEIKTEGKPEKGMEEISVSEEPPEAEDGGKTPF